jgi:hypothetical protein
VEVGWKRLPSTDVSLGAVPCEEAGLTDRAPEKDIASDSYIDLQRVRGAVECYKDGIILLADAEALCVKAGLSAKAAHNLLIDRWCESVARQR